MKNYRNSLSRNFERWARLCYDNPWYVIGIFIVIMVSLGSGLGNLKMDVSNEGMLQVEDPIRQDFNHFRSRFGGDNVIILALSTEGQFNTEILQQVVDIQNEVENKVPHLKKVTSIVNARYTYTEDDTLYVEGLLESWPQHKWKLDKLKEYILSQPNYVNRLISEDGQYISIVIELKTVQSAALLDSTSPPVFLSPQEMRKSIVSLKSILEQYPDLKYALTGTPILDEVLNRITIHDSSLTTGGAFALSILFLAIFFRRISGVVFPILVICGSMIGGLSVMGLTGAPYTLMTGTMAPLMVAVGIADSVHILTHFYSKYEDYGDKRQAMIEAIGFSAPAVLLTSLTTAAGFLSFVFGDLVSIGDMGIYTSVAVIFALVFTVTLLPALFALSPLKKGVKAKKMNLIVNSLLLNLSFFTRRYYIGICLFTISLIVLSIYGATKLSFSHDNVAILSDQEPEKRDVYSIDEAYKGVTSIEVIIDSGAAGGALENDFIAKFKRASDLLSQTTVSDMKLAESYSLLNIIRETNRALNQNQQAFYTVPENSALLAQELLMFEMNNADDLWEVVDSEFRYVRLTLKTHYADSVLYEILINDINAMLGDIFKPSQVSITGSTAIVARIVPYSLSTMIKSFTVALMVITLLMIVMVGDIKLGLLSMIPNFLPLLLVLNVMVFFGWAIDLTTIMVGSIALGIVVDDTLHFLYHYQHCYTKVQNSYKAIKLTLTTTGKALFITTVIYSISAFGNTFASMSNIVIFGITLGLITILALLADIIVLPAFLLLIQNKKQVELQDNQLQEYSS